MPFAALKVPKFEERHLSDVRRYLNVFENIMEQNGWEEDAWALALKSAVVATRLGDIAESSSSCQQMTEEFLLAFGQTPEKLWASLANVKQGEESFRQLCSRVKSQLKLFFELAKSDCTESDTLVKYLVLGNAPCSLQTHLLEHGVARLTLEEFQTVGIAYQQAHGRQMAAETASQASQDRRLRR